jgi:hypothetical protein
MNIREPLRIIEVERLWMPLPDSVPVPIEPSTRDSVDYLRTPVSEPCSKSCPTATLAHIWA